MQMDLSRNIILEIDLNTGRISTTANNYFYNTDKNIAYFYIKLYRTNIVGEKQYISDTDSSQYKVYITTIKPKTITPVKLLGERVMNSGIDDNIVYKITIPNELMKQQGFVYCEGQVIYNNQELTTDCFSFKVNPDKLTEYNLKLITDPDLPILQDLINQIKHNVRGIDDNKISDSTVWSSEYTNAKLATKQELAVERARIDNVTNLHEGSTTGDAELIDGRVGFDGVTYTSIGQSIRTQVGKLNNEVFPNAKFTQLSLTFIEGYYPVTGSIVMGTGNFRSEIDVKVGETYKIKGACFYNMPMYALLDSTGTLKSTFPTTNTTSEEFEKTINILEDGKLIVNYTHSRSGDSEESKPKVYKLVYDSAITQLKNDISTVNNNISTVNDNVNITNTSVSKIKDLIYTDNYTSLDLKFESGAPSISGSPMEGDTYYHCDIIVDVNCKYKVCGYNFWSMPLYLILGENGDILDTYPKTAIEGSLIEKEITTFPTGAKTLRINYTTSVAGTDEKSKPKAYKTTSIFDDDTPIKNIGKTSNLTNIISKYGIIGDSLSSGAQDISGGTSATDIPQFAWATFFEKATGCETVRLAQGGLQLKNWHNLMEQKARIEENKCSAYIIMLGHNDTASEVGTIADVDLTDISNSNTNTQFGMYGKLIGTLRNINPKCKIFCVTYPIYYVENFGTNSIPRTLPNYIDNCYCIDLWKYDKNRSESYNTDFATPNPHFAKTHGTVLGYKNWANIIDSYIDYIIRLNLNKFADVAYIETGKTFN